MKVALMRVAPKTTLAHGLGEEPPERPVPEAERRAVAPFQCGFQLGVLLVSHVAEAKDVGNDLAGDQAVVVVECPLDLRTQPMFRGA